MIRVNLLPPEAQVASEIKFNPAYVVVGVGGLLALSLVPVSVMQYTRRSRLKSEATSLSSELERYKPIVAQVEALEAAKSQLQQRKNIIQTLENERLRYPYFMEDFLKLLPSNIWLTNLATTLPADGSSIAVSVDITALDHYAVADTVSNLETSQIFSDVDIGPIVAAQVATGSQSITFHLTTTYRKAALTTNALKNKNALIAIFGTLFVVVGILYVFSTYIYKPVHQEILKAESDIKDLKTRLAVAKDRAQQLSKMQQEMASLQVDVAQLEKQLPKDRELPALIRVLTHRAETYGVILDNLSPGKAISKGLYDEIPYNVSITTSFHNLGHFLTAMGKGDRLFAARNLALTPTNNKTDTSKTVRATFQLIAFKYHG